jgi:hypothetical protein
MNTRTVAALIEIMTTPEMPTRRRIEAAESILGFEAPTDAISRAREYLISIFENREEAISDRMDALKLSRKFEAKKIAPQTVHLTRREEVDRREAWREYEACQLQQKIILATLDHPPKGWDSDLRSPDYLPPPGDEWPPTGRGPDGKLIWGPDGKLILFREKKERR